MANIFNFPPRNGTSEDKEFAPDASELVQFDTPGRDVTSSAQTPPVQRSARDWSNQDLASIYRVKRLLDAAGVPNHVERSLSDEGDPWCIFCTETGEVFIHLCRIDGLYVLDSPNLSEAISGVDFSDLIARFSEGALRNTEKAAQARRRLIKLERGGKVFLHPAALLAALIWSIYINSEDIVLFMPEDEGEDGFDSDAAIALVHSSADILDAEDAAAEAHFVQSVATPHELVSAEVSEFAGDAFSTRPMQFYKDLAAKGGMALVPSAMAVGLSSIAIAYGFISESYFDEGPVVQAEADTGAPVELDLQLAAPAPDDHNPTAPQAFDLAAVLDAVFDHVMPGQPAADELPELAESTAKIDVASLLEMALAVPDTASAKAFMTNPDLGNDSPALSGTPVPEGLVAPKGPESEVIVISSETPGDTGDTSGPDTLPIVTALFSVADLHATFSVRLTELTTFNTRSDLGLKLASLTPDTDSMTDATLSIDIAMVDEASAPDMEPLISYNDYVPISVYYAQSEADVIDRKAFSFFQYLMAKNEDQLFIVSTEDKFTLIDLNAFNTPGDKAYAMVWNLEHGDTVELVGLKSEFYQFDLIA